jgi:hypothetical protein
MQSTCYSCQFLTKPGLSRQTFGEIRKYLFPRKFVQWEPSCYMRACGRTDGRTDGRNEANSRLSQFCELAYISKLIAVIHY